MISFDARIPGRLQDWLTFKLGEGEALDLIGPTGSGKTSVLHAMAGLLGYEGSVRIDGLEIVDADRRSLAAKIGFVTDEPEREFVAYIVADEVAFTLENLGAEPDEIRAMALKALRDVGAEHLAWRPVWTLSSGEKVRVAIASAMAHGPDVLLLDNVAARLDPPTKHELEGLLEEVVRRGSSVIEARYERREGRDFVELAPNPPLPPEVEKPGGGPQILEVREIWFSYGRKMKHVLRGVSLGLGGGEVVAVMGRNGVGKTTLAKIMAGLLKPSSGEVKGRGCPVVYVPENPDPFFAGVTPEEDVALSLKISRTGGSPQKILELVGASWAISRPMYSLSIGTKKLVAMASALALNPCILILDEPAVGLDAYHKRLVANTLKRAAGRGVAVIAVTHDVGFAVETASRALVLSDGRIVFEGRPDEVRVV